MKSLISSLLQYIYQMKCIGCEALVWGTQVDYKLVLATRKVNAFAKQIWWITCKVMIRKYIIHFKTTKTNNVFLIKTINNRVFINSLVNWFSRRHYNDVIMGAIASQITNLTIVYSTVYSDADQRKHQNSVSLAFVRGIMFKEISEPLNVYWILMSHSELHQLHNSRNNCSAGNIIILIDYIFMCDVCMPF